MPRALLAEALGSMLLAAAVIGSGIMAEQLADGNLAIALLANTVATVAALTVLIATLGPVSGAHLNPAVTLVLWMQRALPIRWAIGYIIVQTAGCCLGATLAHVMFELPLVQTSTHVRFGFGQWCSEAVATAGLVLVILTSRSFSEASWRVPAWIGAAYWFTASTSFANPAITIGRSLTNTFAGIAPGSVPGFIAGQIAGALIGMLIGRALLVPRKTS